MATNVGSTPTFAHLSNFSMGSSTPTLASTATVPAPVDDSADEDVPALDSGLRSLSVSSEDSKAADEAVTPPQTPSGDAAVSIKRARGSDFDDETLARASRTMSTPPKTAPATFVVTPEPATDAVPSTAFVTPPSKLPNKALLSLHKMRFEANDGGAGLGVGPGSPGFENMEGISPGPGKTFRLALGLDKDGGVSSPGEENDSSYATTPTGGAYSLASPGVLRDSSIARRRAQGARSPATELPGQSDSVKIPPTLRGSKILDKLNLSTPPALTSPLSSSPRDNRAPPSPLIARTSAFTFSNTGPLTPLTPSHLPGAPNLNGTTGFDWSSYAIPDSPSTPAATARSLFLESSISPRQPFFLPTPPSDGSHSRPPLMRSQSQLVSSPLAREEQKGVNPFFAVV
ncbi:hypothetical protein MNV49_006675 [Pseudohyphozyma bogoriensis]|nr:hypothetical protein MNV49_006675 [Pseudohyphozyma bogoriensis]